MRFFDPDIEAQAVSDLSVARVAQDRRSFADQHRNVFDPDVESIEQCLHMLIAIEVDVCVRMTVSREEFLDAQSSLVMRRPDEHDVADALSDELHASEDERAHEDLAELRV